MKKNDGDYYDDEFYKNPKVQQQNSAAMHRTDKKRKQKDPKESNFNGLPAGEVPGHKKFRDGDISPVTGRFRFYITRDH